MIAGRIVLWQENYRLEIFDFCNNIGPTRTSNKVRAMSAVGWKADIGAPSDKMSALPDPHEFIRRFLMHVLRPGFHRIHYYGFLTSQSRARNVARIRELLAPPLIPIDAIKALDPTPEQPKTPEHPCPCCGGPMRIIEIFLRGQQPSYRASPMPQAIRIDTS
jgi:hypothetical protein